VPRIEPPGVAEELGLDEAPFVCELVDNVSGLCAEILRVLVDAMEMKS